LLIRLEVSGLKSGGPDCKSDPRIGELANSMKVLADPNRLRIMCFLSKGERCVCEVEEELDISQQLSSHHLNVLREAGFLKVRRAGTWSYYSVDRKRLKGFDGLLRMYLDYDKVKEAAGEPAGCRGGKNGR
jgi:ArsR family transcriptional regulator